MMSPRTRQEASVAAPNRKHLVATAANGRFKSHHVRQIEYSRLSPQSRRIQDQRVRGAGHLLVCTKFLSAPSAAGRTAKRSNESGKPPDAGSWAKLREFAATLIKSARPDRERDPEARAHREDQQRRKSAEGKKATGTLVERKFLTISFRRHRNRRNREPSGR